MALSIGRSRSDTFQRWSLHRPLLYVDEYVWLASIMAAIVALHVTELLTTGEVAPADLCTMALHGAMRCLLPLAVIGLAEHVGRRQPSVGRRVVHWGLAVLALILAVDAATLLCVLQSI